MCAARRSLPKTIKDFGFLYEPAFKLDYELSGPVRPYQPQPADMFMSTDKMAIIQWGHKVCGANAPHHSGIIIRKPDGQYCTLEAGPHNCLTVKVLDLTFSLSSYQAKGNSVWIRRRSVPLTPDQADKLAAFAMAQDGKRFALGRMLAQLTPLRSRQPALDRLRRQTARRPRLLLVRRTRSGNLPGRRHPRSQPHPSVLHLSQRTLLRTLGQSLCR